MSNHITAAQAARAITDATELSRHYLDDTKATPWVLADSLTSKTRPLTAEELKRGQRYLDRQLQHRAALTERVRRQDLAYEAELRRERARADTRKLRSARVGMAKIKAAVSA